MKKMTAREARAFVERFEEVNRFEIEEMKRTPLREKLLQCVRMMGFALRLAPRDDWGDETSSVRDRWLKLRERTVG